MESRLRVGGCASEGAQGSQCSPADSKWVLHVKNCKEWVGVCCLGGVFLIFWVAASTSVPIMPQRISLIRMSKGNVFYKSELHVFTASRRKSRSVIMEQTSPPPPPPQNKENQSFAFLPRS